jgi:hypothetical protein
VDGRKFDRWARSLGGRRSRRGVLAALVGGAALLVTRGRANGQTIDGTLVCGGFAALPCPEGFVCVDDPNDLCNPALGGADCSGICVPIDYNPCAAILCIEGTTCCPNCGGVCVPAGTPCSEAVCGGELCNEAICGPGEYCCNESCSRCVPLGSGCTRELCPPRPPVGEPCGGIVCGPGEYCCNPSCEICAPIGGGCIEIFCDPTPAGVPCGPTTCQPGEVCCNESCGICTPPDGVCVALYCGE